MITQVLARANDTAGFFSSAKRMSLPLGSAADPQAVRGYPIDLRVKAVSTSFPPQEWGGMTWSYVAIAQYGLGCYERWIAGEGEPWLGAAITTGRHLLDNQEPDGSWLHQVPFPHTFPTGVPWRCGMAQGEAASLLVRLYQETGEEQLAEAARRAIAPLARGVREAGVSALLDGTPWPEEYPTEPPSFVLNGAIFAWWGARDVGVAFGDRAATQIFETGVDVLATNLSRFDTGRWSLYCLRRYPVPHVASSFYHALHITQLEAMQRLAPRPEFDATRNRWIEYMGSPPLRWLALSQKVLFRIVVPRNRLLASRLPWTRR
jgi:hypothetical protein